MPLDPQARALIDQIAALGLPTVQDQTPAAAREGMQLRRAALGPGEPVERVEDRTIDGPGGSIPLRIYTPSRDGSLPVVVYFHGGGWVIGDIESHDRTCRALANRSGCVVVSVDYRLAPEHKFPAAAEDAYAATVWVAEHAGALDADGGRLAVAGDSAGGNLAAVVSLLARERGGPRIAFQLLIYPVTDFNLDTVSYLENGVGYSLTRDGMLWFWRHYLNDEAEGRHYMASPLQAESLTGLPPAHVITAEFDPLRDEGEAYAGRLQAAGVPVVCSRYDGMIHGFFSNPQVLDKAVLAIDEAGRALSTALLRPKLTTARAPQSGPTRI